ncbi:MAG: hypothetical protein WCP68_10575 [Enhydrobacter sp.]
MDEMLLPLALAFATTVLATVALAVAHVLMGDWSVRRKMSQR